MGDVERIGEKGSSEEDMSMIQHGVQRRWRGGAVIQHSAQRRWWIDAAADEEGKDVDWGADIVGSSCEELSQPHTERYGGEMMCKCV